MRNYIILNNKNSNEINGLLIQELPAITKPKMRTQIEEIDGRAGDIVTQLGYAAYTKTISVGLYGDFDINEVISYFNSSGTVVFSNEPDKYYNYEIIDQIDFNRLVRFRTAKVKMHVQPFKYPTEEEPLVAQYQLVTNTGSDMSLNNTANALFRKLDLKGNTEQTQYTGKNLWSFNSTYVNDTASTRWVLTDTQYILPAGTYTFSCNAPSGAFIRINYKYSDNVDHLTDIVNGKATMTFTQEIQKIAMTLGANTTITNIQLETGSNPTDYEPFVGGIPSPSPSYPQEVHTVSGNNSIQIRANSNLQSGDELYQKMYDYDTNYVSELIDGNINAIKFNPFAYRPLGGTMDFNCYAGWKENTQYTIRCLVKKVSGTNIYLQALYTDGTTNNAQIAGSTTNYTQLRLLTSSGKTIERIGFSYGNAGDWLLDKSSWYIGEGNQTEYPEYQGKSYQVNLGSLELCKIGDYQDYLYKENGTWYLHKEIGKYVVNITQINGSLGNGNKYSVIVPTNKAQIYGSLCYCNKANYNITNAQDGQFYQNAPNFVFVGNSTETLETMQTKYNGALLYYVLATPTNTEITDADLIEQLEALKQANSYEGQTNISHDSNDLPFIVDVSAVQSGTDELVVNNEGNIYARPTLDIEGTGMVNVYLEGNQMFQVDLSENNEIVIDTDEMEAYDPSTQALMNRQVTGNYDNFKIVAGNNNLKFSGDLTKATVTNYERWL